jgi:putative transposase
MGIARSTYYDRPERAADDTAIVEAIFAVCDDFECYGYRRVGAALRQQGLVVNAKKIRRLMREHDLQPKVRRRFVSTTDSDHDGPISPTWRRILPRLVRTSCGSPISPTSPCRAASPMSPSSWMPGRA